MGRIIWLTETEEGQTVISAMARDGDVAIIDEHDIGCIRWWVDFLKPDLVVVCGFRRLLPPDILALPPRGVVGFHSARLPEYPGRAPVPWAIVRGDTETATTMLFLDEGVDSGDIIDSRPIPIEPGDTVESLYAKMAQADIEMLYEHLPAILAGTVVRHPQDVAYRGPLTTKDGWDRYRELMRMRMGHA